MPKSSAGAIIKKVLIALAVAFVVVGLFFFFFAVPQLGKVRRSANEMSAIQSLRTISQAQLSYNSIHPTKGFACSLHTLADPPDSLISAELGSGTKSGYTFALACGGKATINNDDQYTSFKITAVPATIGETGNRGFCTDENMEIKVDSTGGTNCKTPLE